MKMWRVVLLFVVLVALSVVLFPILYTVNVPPTRQVEIVGTVAGYSVYENQTEIWVYVKEFSRRYADTGEKLWFMPGKIADVALPKDTPVQEIQPGTVITVFCPAWDFGMWEQNPCYISK